MFYTVNSVIVIVDVSLSAVAWLIFINTNNGSNESLVVIIESLDW